MEEDSITIIWDRVNGTFDTKDVLDKRIIIEDNEGNVVADIWP